MIGGLDENVTCPPYHTTHVELILIKRRFRCEHCHKIFTEPDNACGWRRRTTARLRQAIREHGFKQPFTDVGNTFGVSARFVHTCFQSVLQKAFMARGRSLEEGTQLVTPRFLRIDEFARRKGHIDDTILCDLQARKVLEVSEGRTLEAVCSLLARLEHPERGEAVSMDMSASFRPAVQRCFVPLLSETA